MSYAEVGRDAARLAHALRDLGVTGDQRVGTFMWNNAEHLVAYLAVPSMGAVLHTINIRLFPEQLVYIVNHAEDGWCSSTPPWRRRSPGSCPRLRTVRHVVLVSGGGQVADDVRAALAEHAAGARLGRPCSSGRPDTFDWPELDERDAAAMCYTSGTTGNPKGVAYSHRSIVPALAVRVPAARRSACGRATGCSPSCRCSTRTPGACRTRRSWPARR